MAAEPIVVWGNVDGKPVERNDYFYVAVAAYGTKYKIRSVTFNFFESNGATPRSVTKYNGSSSISHTVYTRSWLDLYDLGVDNSGKADYFAVKIDVASLTSWDSTAGNAAEYITAKVSVTTEDSTVHDLSTRLGSRSFCKYPTNPKIIYIDPINGVNAASRGTSALPLLTLAYACNTSPYSTNDYDVAYVKPGVETITTQTLVRSGTQTKFMVVKPWPNAFDAGSYYDLCLTHTSTSSVAGYLYQWLGFDGGADKKIRFRTLGDREPAAMTGTPGATFEVSREKRYLATGQTEWLGYGTDGSAFVYLKVKNNDTVSVQLDSISYSAERGNSMATITYPVISGYTTGSLPKTITAGQTWICKINWPTTPGTFDSDLSLQYTRDPSGSPTLHTYTQTFQGAGAPRAWTLREDHNFLINCKLFGEYKDANSMFVKVDASATSHFSIINCEYERCDNLLTMSGDSDVILSNITFTDCAGTLSGSSVMTAILWQRIVAWNNAFGYRHQLGEDGNANAAHRNTWNSTTEMQDCIHRLCRYYNNGGDATRNGDGDSIDVPLGQHTVSGSNTFARFAVVNNILRNYLTNQQFWSLQHSSSSQSIQNIIVEHNTIEPTSLIYATGFLIGHGNYNFCYFRNNIGNNYGLVTGTLASEFQGGGKDTEIVGAIVRNYSTGLTFTPVYTGVADTISLASQLLLNNIQQSGDPRPAVGSIISNGSYYGVSSSDVDYDYYGNIRNSVHPWIGAAETNLSNQRWVLLRTSNGQVALNIQ